MALQFAMKMRRTGNGGATKKNCDVSVLLFSNSEQRSKNYLSFSFSREAAAKISKTAFIRFAYDADAPEKIYFFTGNGDDYKLSSNKNSGTRLYARCADLLRMVDDAKSFEGEYALEYDKSVGAYYLNRGKAYGAQQDL